jgi:hypothetical protein
MLNLVWLGVAAIAILIWVKYRKKPTVSFFYIIFLLIVVGTALLIVRPPYFVSEEFFHALGHAFIIAAILAITVDHYVKERVLREVSLDVSKYLVGYRLPEEVQNRIRELMQTKFIRRKFEVRCTFTESQSGKKLIAEFQIADELQNITSEPLFYQDSMEFEKHESVIIHEMKCHSSDIAASYHYDSEALKDFTTANDTHTLTCGKGLQIPPVVESVGSSYRFQSKYQQIHPTAFSDYISFKFPTIGVSVEIANAPKNYLFFVTPKPEFASHHRWEYKRLFLPGERITISWKRIAGKGAR